jgi:hypothetical protein
MVVANAGQPTVRKAILAAEPPKAREVRSTLCALLARRQAEGRSYFHGTILARCRY